MKLYERIFQVKCPFIHTNEEEFKSEMDKFITRFPRCAHSSENEVALQNCIENGARSISNTDEVQCNIAQDRKFTIPSDRLSKDEYIRYLGAYLMKNIPATIISLFFFQGRSYTSSFIDVSQNKVLRKISFFSN